MFARRGFGTADLADLQRIEALVRDRFGLGDDDLVLVSQDASRLPGAPERMTTILFWNRGGDRRRLRIYKPVARISDADLPARWLEGALGDDGEGDCC